MTDTESNELPARQMRMEWSTDAGQVVLSFPSNLSERDVEDVEELFQITFTGMLRRARAAKSFTEGSRSGG